MRENRDRDGIGRWRPGSSGNPGGRPRGLADMRREAADHSQEAVATLVRLMREGPPAVALAAARELLDRGFGRTLPAPLNDASGLLEKPLARSGLA